MSVNGQDYRSNVYLLDGTLLNDFTNGPAGSAAGTALGIESIQEFRVEANAYSAEYGRNFGGQINVLTKSGSNALRGSAYEFHRNDALDAAQLLRRRRQARFHAQPVRRRARRSARPGSPVLLRRLRSAARESRQDDLELRAGRQRARAACCPTARSRSATPSARISTRFRAPTAPSIGSRPRHPHVRLRPDARSELLPGPRRLPGGAAHQFFGATPFDDADAAAADRLSRSSRARSSRPTSSRRSSTATSLSARTFQTARFGYSRTRIGQNVEANLAPPLPPFVDGRGARRRHRHRRHAALRSAELGEPAAGAERLQRPVRRDARARRATCSRPASSPSTIATS